nr:MAG TPA_asm: hypothetical protein [Caudoviricetes sp.]
MDIKAHRALPARLQHIPSCSGRNATLSTSTACIENKL